MKKIFVMALMAAAIGFTSCGSKEEVKNDEAAALVEELQSQIESGDASAIQTTLEAAQAKIAEMVAENPEAAKDYVTKVQDFLKENTEKINAVVGDNAVATGIVNTIVNAPAETVVNLLTAGQSVVDNAKSTADSTAEAAQDAAQEKVSEVVNAANAKVEEAKAEANQKVEAAKAEASQKVEAAKADANKKVNEAAQKANQKVNEGAEKLLKSAGLK